MSFLYEVKFRDGEAIKIVAKDAEFAASLANEGIATNAPIVSITTDEEWIFVCSNIHCLRLGETLYDSYHTMMPYPMLKILSDAKVYTAADLSKVKWDDLQKLFPDDPKKAVVLREFIAVNRIRMKDPAYYEGYFDPDKDEDEDEGMGGES